MELNRRVFLQSLAVSSLCDCSSLGLGKKRIMFGVCTGNENVAKLAAAGFDFVEGGVAHQLQPNASDAEYAAKIAEIRALPLPMVSCNGFIPSELQFLDVEADRAKALEYATRACFHADLAGVSYIIFGSGRVRRVPEGGDPKVYRARFVKFCQELGVRIKSCRMTVLLEPLNKTETNFLNTVEEGIGFVDEIGSPRVQMVADLYHMRREGETPDVIRKAGARIKHVHIAENRERTVPGTDGDDFTPFFDALRDIGYSGGVSCECSWPKGRTEETFREALAVLKKF